MDNILFFQAQEIHHERLYNFRPSIIRIYLSIGRYDWNLLINIGKYSWNMQMDFKNIQMDLPLDFANIWSFLWIRLLPPCRCPKPSNLNGEIRSIGEVSGQYSDG